jgi:flagellar hook-basal body complex protein FliE
MKIDSINAQLAKAVSALQSRSAGQAASASATGADFVTSLDSALKSVSDQQKSAGELQRQFQLENSSVSLEETMIAMNKSQISFQAAVQVRNKLVQAYEQIMNMPV